jgi:hypothetical protein
VTLDDFLRAFELLIDDRETREDDPGEGNFNCEDCRACNNCRFCIGCDSCEDCTYCEESIDCTSCTQSKRCVGCEKVSYCGDSRDCKGSRYLTLCVSCTDCVHCLACVGLDGAEFYVLNQKRTRKEYFALLRQVQEIMEDKMHAGWRPPGIGLASEVFDAQVGQRNPELSAAPWLAEIIEGPADPSPEPEPRYDDEPEPEPRYEPEPEPEPRIRDRSREDRGYRDYQDRAPEPRDPAPAYLGDIDDDLQIDPREPDGRRREPAPRRGRDFDGSASERSPRRYDDRARARGSDRHGDEAAWDDAPRGPRERPPSAGPTSSWRGSADRPRDDLDREFDAPAPRQEQPTQPFQGRGAPARRRGDRDPYYDEPHGDGYGRGRGRERGREPERPRDRPREAPREPERGREGRGEDSPWLDRPRRDPEADAPGEREREPSSPWLDDPAASARRRAKRGSLRRAGRPKRKPEGEDAREGTGTGTGSSSYRTGSAPKAGRRDPEGTHTGTGLRLGRKPKRKR